MHFGIVHLFCASLGVSLPAKRERGQGRDGGGAVGPAQELGGHGWRREEIELKRDYGTSFRI